MATHHSSDAQFDKDVLESNIPVLVDFWAEWCGPCKKIAPILEELADELAGQVKIVKLDIEANPEKPVHYGVRAIPTLILFADGQPSAVATGARGKQDLLDWLGTSLPSLKIG